jgi:glucose/arabinose dehydrogenase
MTRRQHIRNILIMILIAAVGAYWYLTTPDKARLELSQMQGKIPKLDAMRPEQFPTVKIAKIVGWDTDAAPVAAKGLAVTAFAGELDHPRWLHVLPNGDVLVAESTQPAREASGISDWIAKKIIMDANGTVTSANRITLLRDADGDGVAEFRSVLLEGLNSPFGMALYGESLLVANTDEVRAFPFKVGDTKITAKGQKMMSLPAGAPNNHWARNIIVDAKGENLFVTIGSNSNIAENGAEAEKDRAQIKQYNLKTGSTRIYAYGIRNPNGLAFNPISGTLWMTVNERDMLGSDGPPDYLSTVDFGTFYGWPWYYWGGMEDRRVPQSRRDLRQYSKRPDYALGPHVAALGLAFSPGKSWGATYANGAFVAMHGSWNRFPVSGYKVVYIPYNERGFPQDDVKPADVLTGFLTESGEARGRPAGIAFDKGGGLLVADDAGNRIWRVTPTKDAMPKS